jgi:hypothetical protein
VTQAQLAPKVFKEFKALKVSKDQLAQQVLKAFRA